MAEILGGEGAEVVARDERQVVVVRRAAAARRDLEQVRDLEIPLDYHHFY